MIKIYRILPASQEDRAGLQAAKDTHKIARENAILAEDYVAANLIWPPRYRATLWVTEQSAMLTALCAGIAPPTSTHIMVEGQLIETDNPDTCISAAIQEALLVAARTIPWDDRYNPIEPAIDLPPECTHALADHDIVAAWCPS
jgi:hypothetical protein